MKLDLRMKLIQFRAMVTSISLYGDHTDTVRPFSFDHYFWSTGAGAVLRHFLLKINRTFPRGLPCRRTKRCSGYYFSGFNHKL